MIAMLFAGQGAQAPGMGLSFYENSTAVQEVFQEVSDALGRDIAHLCFEGSQEELNQTINTQPALFTCDVAAMVALNEKGIVADICAGFSLGEYAALVCAGVLTLSDAAKLVQARAQAMSDVQQGGMMAVLGLSAAEVEEICSSVKAGYVIPVNYNCPGQVVVAGDKEALIEVASLVKEKKKRSIPLAVSGAFHSRFMEPAGVVLRESLEQIEFHAPNMPIIGNVTAQTLPGADPWIDILQKQCASPVLWQQSIETMVHMGVTNFIECGPGKVLSGFNKKICSDITTFSVNDIETRDVCIQALHQ